MIKTLLAQALIFCGLTRIDRVTAAPAQAPFRIRLNKNLITKIIHLRDQEIFKVFEDVELTDEDWEHASAIKFSLEPSGVALDDFDVDLQLSKEYLGAETDKVAASGTVTLKDGTEVAFTAPVPLAKIQYTLGTKWNEQYTIDQLEYQQKEWTFKTGTVAGEGLSPEAGEEIANAIDKHVDEFKTKLEKGSKTGEMEHIKNFPMDTVIPIAGLFYATNFAEYVEYNDTFASMGFSLGHWKMLKEKQIKMLKPISQDFDKEKNKDGYEALVQMTVDDNLFNSFATVFTSVDKTFSLREMMKQNPKTRPFVQQMTTQVLGMVFPSFADQYGSNSAIDVMMSPSHALFLEGFPNSKMSGIYIDRNGNWKIQINFPMTILVEKPGKQWEEARSIYITMVFKFKISVNDVNPSTKKFAVTPKNLEITNLKVLKSGQEEEMEQMMIQSVVNIQLENLKKEFKEFPFHLSDILSKNPKELQCLGFNIADLDISFKKSQVQFSAYYKDTKHMNKKLCDDFLAELRESPNKIFNQFIDQDKMMKSIKEAQKLSAGDKSANPFDSFANMAKVAQDAQKKQTEEVASDHDEL